MNERVVAEAFADVRQRIFALLGTVLGFHFASKPE